MDLPDKSKPEATQSKKVAGPVVSGAVPVTRPATRRFMDFVFAESPKAIGHKVAIEVVMPKVKEGLFAAGQAFLAGMLFKGDSATMNMTRGAVMRGGSAMYSTPVGGGSSLVQARQATEQKRVSYEDLVFPTQADAEIVLANLIDLMNTYRVVAIGDLNDLVGNSSQPSDNAYGWNNLDGVRISQDRNGFRLELPRPVLI